MTGVSIAVVGMVLSAAVTAALIEDRSPFGSRVAKMIASTLMVALAVALVSDWSAYAAFVVAALGASWIGDLALSFSGRTAFVIGLVAFAVAHLLYIAAFGTEGAPSVPWLIAGAVGMTVVGVAVLRWLGPHRPDELRVPLTVYIVIIGVMVAAAFGTLGSSADVRIPLAASMFAASDVLVARQQFVVRDTLNRVVGLPLYFAAQLLFAFTVG